MRNKDFLRGILVAFVVLASGFLMMLLFYNTIDYPKDLPGLFFYQAATWGDCLCLPLIAGFLSAFLSKNKAYKSQCNNRITFSIMIIGMLLGASMQASWLIGDTTVLNWTLPYAHCFNIAGWWHSLFFIGMFGLLFYQVTLFFQIVRVKNSQVDDLDTFLWTGALSMGGCYLLVHFHDDFSRFYSSASIYASVMFALWIILMILFRVFLNKEVREKLQKGTIVSLFISLGIAIIICEDVKGDVLLALGISLLLNVIWKTNTIFKTILILAVMSASLFSVFYYITGLDGLMERIIMLLTVCIFAIFMETRFIDDKTSIHYSTLSVLGYFVYVLYLGLPQEIQSYLSSLIGNVLPVEDILLLIAVVLGFQCSCETVFLNIVEKENEENCLSDNIKKIKIINYCKIVALVIGIVAILVCWFLEVLDSEKLRVFFSLQFSPRYLIYYLISAFLIILMSVVRKIKQKSLGSIVSACALLCIANIIIACFDFILQNKDFSLSLTVPNVMLLALILCSSIGASLLVSQGFYHNTIKIRGNKEQQNVKVIKNTFLYGGLLIYLCNAAILVFGFSPSGFFIFLFNAVFLSELIPVACAYSLKLPENHSGKMILTTVTGGVRQDGFSTIIAQLFLTCLPCTLLYLSDKSELKSWVVLISLMITGMKVVKFFIRNNRDYVYSRMKDVNDSDSILIKEWFALREWISKQQRITAFTALPYFAANIICQLFSFRKFCRDQKRTRDKKEGITTLKSYIEWNLFDNSKYDSRYRGLEEKYRQMNNNGM